MRETLQRGVSLQCGGALPCMAIFRYLRFRLGGVPKSEHLVNAGRLFIAGGALLHAGPCDA